MFTFLLLATAVYLSQRLASPFMPFFPVWATCSGNLARRPLQVLPSEYSVLDP